MKRQVTTTFNTQAPEINCLIMKPKAPWLTNNFRLIMMKLRDRAFSRYKKSKINAHWDYYKSLSNLVNKFVYLQKKACLQYKPAT